MTRAREAPSRLKQTAHLLNLLLPFAGFAAAVTLLWNSLVTWTDLALLGGFYLAAGFGITVGFHRLTTHHAFATSRAVEDVFAVLGSLALQGSVIDWVADHRRHHAHADRPGDPHSPHGEDGPTFRGLVHAHVGWLFHEQGAADRARYAPDLLERRDIVLIDRLFPLWALLTLALPFAAGLALTGALHGGLTGLLWGGLARVFLFHHVVFTVNSVGHCFGRRRFETRDRSTNLAWLAPLSLGESWHNDHHAYPRSATLGVRWFEIDPSGLLIRGLARVGIARNVVRLAPNRRARPQR